MRRKMERLANKLDRTIINFVETDLSSISDNYIGYKYFLIWSTNEVYACFRSQAEAVEALEMIIEVGYIMQGNVGVKVVK